MEPFAAKTVLTSLVTDYELDIATFTTDRSSSMRTLMREPGLSHISHEFDPWHWISMHQYNSSIRVLIFCFSEMVMKEVFKAAKNNNCVKLSLWKDSISNMLWWSFATSS